jgi:hypothetical protein
VCKVLYGGLPKPGPSTVVTRVYMIDKLTATLTATRSTISPSTKIITHDHPPDRDHGGPSRTLRMDLRIRRLGVRIPPGAPASSLVKIFFSRSARVRCRWTLGAIAGAIGRQQRLGHPNSSCALLTLQRWPYCVLAEIVPDSEVLEAVEDEIEAELVLLAVVVAGAGVRAHWSVGRGAGTPSRELQQKAFASSEVSSGVPNARLPSCSANP